MPVSRIDELLPAQPGDKLPPHADYVAMCKALGIIRNGLATNEFRPLWRGPEEGGPLGNGHPRPQPSPTRVREMSGSSSLPASKALAPTTGSSTAVTRPAASRCWPTIRTLAGSPAIWYFTRQKAPGIEVSGATLPGAPSVILGRTKGVAWGFTNTGPDVQDLYIEEINERGEARTPDGWQKLHPRRNLQGQRRSGRTDHRARVAPRADHFRCQRAAGRRHRQQEIRRRAALDRARRRQPERAGSPAMNKAQTVAELKEALRHHVAPQQNVVMADTQGNTAFIAAGRVPVRKPENDINGLAPAPGLGCEVRLGGLSALRAIAAADS